MPSPVPPFTVPTGQTVLWSTPTSVTASGFVSGSCFGTLFTQDGTGTTSGGSLFMTGSCPIGAGGNPAFVLWSDFVVPAMPPGTVINSIYPVIIGSGIQADVAQILYAGRNITPTMPVTSPGNVNQASFSGSWSGQFSDHMQASLGNTLLDITAQLMAFDLWNTLDANGFPDQATITFVGLAVYVTITSNPSSIWINVGNTKNIT